MRAISSLRIEMVLPALARGGMEVMASQLTRALGNRGHHVGVTCIECDGPLADDLRNEGFRVSVVPAPGVRGNLRAPALERWFQQQQPDVVHVHSGAWMKAARAARRAKVPRVVHTVHGLLDQEPWHSTFQKRFAARYTDSIAAVSESLREYLADGVKLDRRKITVIANGIDTTRFTPGPRTGYVRKALELPDESLLIGNVAGLKPVKDHLLLLEAFRRVRDELPRTHLVIVGDGPLHPALQERAIMLGMAEVVHFMGAVRNPAAIYRDLDLFVSSSKAEGTSMSILEAMASGVPVVATSVGGTPDALAQGACGWLVPPADRDTLTSAIVSLLCDAAERRRLALAARVRAVERYSEDAMVHMYEALYQGRSASSIGTTAAVGRCVG